MKKKISGVICLTVVCLVISLFGTTAFASDFGKDVITLGKIPVDVTIDADENNYFVKGLLDNMGVSISRAETTKEEVENLLMDADNEILMFPSEYSIDETPIYMFTFITDGYTNAGASLVRILNVDSWLYFQGVLEGYYTEEEEPSWQDYYVTQTAVFAVCDRAYISSSGELTNLRARDYYTIWNGDLVQVMLVYNQGYKDVAVKWAEEYLATWEDAAE